MNFKPVFSAKQNTIIGLIGMLCIASCASTEPKVPNWGHHANGDGPLGHHEKGVVHIDKPIIVEAPKVEYAPPPVIAKNYDSVSNLFGCTGAFSLQAENGQIIATGRAYNAPEGLYIIGNDGKKTGKIINNTTGQSLIFSPDCGCNKALNVTPETKFMGTMPSGMTCHD